jgi:hypothetical protein
MIQGGGKSDSFPIQSGLKQGDALSLLFFNFALEYAIRKAQENQAGLKLNGTHKRLAYADDVNVLGDNLDTINKITKTKQKQTPWPLVRERTIPTERPPLVEIKSHKPYFMPVRKLVWNKRRENEVYVGVSGTECRPKSVNKNKKHTIWKFVTIQVFGKDSNRSKFVSGGNQWETEFR